MKDNWEYARKIKTEKRNKKLAGFGLTRELLTKLYWDNGYSIPELRNIYSGIEIYEQMKKWNIPRRSTSEGFHLAKMKQLEEKGITEELLEDLYINQKFSTRALDKKFGFTVSYYLKYFGIPVRKNTDHNNYRIRSPGIGQKISIAQKQYYSDPLNREKVSKRMKLRIASGWKPNTKPANDKVRELLRKGEFHHYTFSKPNKGELELQSIINKACPNEYKYTGGGTAQIDTGSGFFYPDFTHNYKKKVIEYFGDYWHNPETVQCNGRQTEPGRIDIYHSVGFDCLVIWEHDLREKSVEQLIKIIQTFNNKELEPYNEISEVIYAAGQSRMFRLDLELVRINKGLQYDRYNKLVYHTQTSP